MAIEKEIKELEKAKERQKQELQVLIQHNLNSLLKKKEIEEKVSPSKYRIQETKSVFYNPIRNNINNDINYNRINNSGKTF